MADPRKVPLVVGFVALILLASCGKEGAAPVTGGATGNVAAIALTDAQVDNLVRRSYQFVAMYNVNNKFALKQGGWNTCVADTRLKDHTMREIFSTCLPSIQNMFH
jgi:hypothetical protein